MKELKTIVANELHSDENIFVTTKSKLDDLNDEQWWKFEEYTNKSIFEKYTGKEKVLSYWHEDGLCIILK